MSQLLPTMLAPEDLAALRLPINEARTQPRQAFLSADFFELELNKVFSSQWVALCFAEQLSGSGAVLPLEFGGMPVFVARENEDIRVFHNIVPYDGCLAVMEPAEGLVEIRSPYHGWCYGLDGRLRKLPYWDGTPNPEPAVLAGKPGDLINIRCHCAMGIVFVDFSGSAPEFEQQFEPLNKALADYRIEELVIGRDEQGDLLIDQEDLKTNWKTHYENWAINVLHEGFTHEIYAESTQIPRVNSAGDKTYRECLDGDFMALSYREADFAETYELDEMPLKSIGHDLEVLPERACIGSFFPNLHFAVFPYFVHMIIVHPQSAGHTKTLRAQFYDADSAGNAECLDERLELQAEFQQAGLEDSRVTEAVQKARRSPVYEQHYYSPFWDRMHYYFSNRLLDTLERNTNQLRESQ